MTFRDDLVELIRKRHRQYSKVRGNQLTNVIVNHLPGDIEDLITSIITDEAVVREVQWHLIEKDGARLSFDEVAEVLSAFNSVLRNEEIQQKEEASGE